ncbi:MAG: potassium channel family protein [Solirubrobacterales bacterium]|nr:potassium channel family protein [Solirubrobacterales bacterium]
MTKNRLEAFSDGVFAVAITLLVLELNVPAGDHLWHQLKEEWPSFAAFFVSFWVIGIIWVNHHGVLDHLKRANRAVLYLNLLVLMTVVFIPFSTALIAEHLKSGADESVAAAVYSGAFLAMGVAFGSLWTYITRHRDLLGVELSDDEVRRRSVAFTIGNPFYAVAVIMAFISPAVVLVIIGALAVYYMVIGMRSPDIQGTDR